MGSTTHKSSVKTTRTSVQCFRGGTDSIARWASTSQDEVVIGIPGYTLREDNSFWNALLMPFRKQRDYWRRPDGALVERQNLPGEQNTGRLAK